MASRVSIHRYVVLLELHLLGAYGLDIDPQKDCVAIDNPYRDVWIEACPLKLKHMRASLFDQG